MYNVSSSPLNALHLGFLGKYLITIESRTYIDDEVFDFTTQTLTVVIKVEWVNLNGETGLSIQLSDIVNRLLPPKILLFFNKLFKAHNSEIVINSQGCIVSVKPLNNHKPVLQQLSDDDFYTSLDGNEKKELDKIYGDTTVNKFDTSFLENYILFPIFPGLLSRQIEQNNANIIQTRKIPSQFMPGVENEINLYINSSESDFSETTFNLILSSDIESLGAEIGEVAVKAAEYFKEEKFPASDYDYKIYGDYQVNNSSYITFAEVEFVESLNGNQIEFSKLITLKKV